jgi:hypothetical protein
LKALLARKKQFKGLKPCLEYLEGAAGPKKAIQNNFDQKFPRRSKHSLLEEPHSRRSAKNKVVKKLCVCLSGTKERSTKNLEGSPVKKSSERKGCIPLRFERTLTSLCPLSRKESTYPKKRVIADDMLRRVVTPSSAGMA